MGKFERDIDSWERMAEVIREVGLMPFFKCGVPGWSVQDRTAPGCWFDEDGTEDGLGPWDWKVDVVREGDIAFGKLLGNKSAFVSVEWYAHLMNWRRSIPRYRMAEGKRFKAVTKSDKELKKLAPVALAAIRENGSMLSKELRAVCGVKKAEMEKVMTFLQMGTWSVVGDIQRVFNGPNLTYKGWQIASNTTPEGLFGFGGTEEVVSDGPSWAKFIEDDGGESPLEVKCSPAESRELLIAHVMEMFPEADRKVVEKMIG